jgi:hypothetical protein
LLLSTSWLVFGIMLSFAETVEAEAVVPDDELEAPEELLLAAATATVAVAGDPTLASPCASVSAMLKRLPAARAMTGTEMFLVPDSPSAQLTTPLVAV